jgi:hypothetical protein
MFFSDDKTVIPIIVIILMKIKTENYKCLFFIPNKNVYYNIYLYQDNILSKVKGI